jgi:hypothetical protein
MPIFFTEEIKAYADKDKINKTEHISDITCCKMHRSWAAPAQGQGENVAQRLDLR